MSNITVPYHCASKTSTIVSCISVDGAKNQNWHCSTCILCRRAVRLELATWHRSSVQLNRCF